MKDHEKRELVNRLTKLAQEYAETQQLRDRVAGEVLPAIDAAIDAALNLWPRDCRTCRNFTTASGGCISVLRCEDSSAYKATQPVQLWEKRPAGPAPF